MSAQLLLLTLGAASLRVTSKHFARCPWQPYDPCCLQATATAATGSLHAHLGRKRCCNNAGSSFLGPPLRGVGDSSMKNNAIIGNIDHFDYEIVLNGLNKLEGIAQLDPSKNSMETKAYKNDGYLPPKELDEKAACLHLLFLRRNSLITLGFVHLLLAQPASTDSELRKKVKNNAIIGNVRHFGNEIDVNGLAQLVGIAQLDPSKNSKETKAYKNDEYLPPKELDEKAACLHLPALRRNSLTTLGRVNLLLALPASADFLAEPSCCLRQPSDFSCPWQPSPLLESFETSSATAATSHCTGVG